jgi:hypothetical protein
MGTVTTPTEYGGPAGRVVELVVVGATVVEVVVVDAVVVTARLVVGTAPAVGRPVEQPVTIVIAAAATHSFHITC